MNLRSVIRKLFFLITALVNLCALAQSENDSLLSVISKQKDDSLKAKNLVWVTDNCLRAGDLSNLEKYAKEALKLSEKLNYTPGIKSALKNLGICFEYKGDYILSLDYSERFMDLCKKTNDQSALAEAYNNLGIVYEYLGKTPLAFKFHLSSLRIKEALKNDEACGISHVNIASLYGQQKKFDDALEHFKMAISLFGASKNQEQMGFAHSGIGSVFQSKGDYKEALKHHRWAYEAWKETGNMPGRAFALNNIGTVYALMKDDRRAMENLAEALRLNREMGDQRNTALSMLAIAGSHILQKEYKKAKLMVDSAVSIAEVIGDVECLRDAYSYYTKADSGLGNFKSAFEMYKKFVFYSDSLVNETSKQKNLQEEMQYEFDKRELSMKAKQKAKEAVAEQKLSQQRIISWVIAGGALIAVGMGVIALVGFRRARRANAEISEQKKIIEVQKTKVESAFSELHEKNKEVMDSIRYAKRIQRSLLPQEKVMERSLKLLNKKQ